MTKNQIDYWNYVEAKRHNRETERENERANLERERENRRSNKSKEGEIHRSNLASEAVKREANAINAHFNEVSLNEQQRRNLASELLTAQSQDIERARIKLGYAQAETSLQSAHIAAGPSYAQVGLGYSNLAELNRHQLAVEEEQRRSNFAKETASWSQAESSATNAQANLINAQTRQRQQSLAEKRYQELDVPSAMVNIAQQRSRISVDRAQEQRWQHQNATDTVNAGARIIDSVAGLAGKIINPIGGKSK